MIYFPGCQSNLSKYIQVCAIDYPYQLKENMI